MNEATTHVPALGYHSVTTELCQALTSSYVTRAKTSVSCSATGLYHHHRTVFKSRRGGTEMAKTNVPGRPEENPPADQQEAETRPCARRTEGIAKVGVRVDVENTKNQILKARVKLQRARRRLSP